MNKSVRVPYVGELMVMIPNLVYLHCKFSVNSHRIQPANFLNSACKLGLADLGCKKRAVMLRENGYRISRLLEMPSS